MSQCSNCYNGCSEIVSDKCVKYTGIDVPVLNIKTGDSLSYVEQALITFLTATIDGSGIKINLEESDYCTLVTQYLQTCQEVTALDLFRALVKAACDLQTQVTANTNALNTLNADYNVECLDGVVDSSDTHLVVQAIITKLCEIDVNLTALATDVSTNYVKIADINDYIAAYLAEGSITNRYYTRMVPYAIQAYYGSLSFFDVTGAGLSNTAWEKIYLCNGKNSTPDLRGRSIVGAIAGVPGGSLSPAVNPASNPTFNPNYSLGTLYGSTNEVLGITQIPSHNHSATSTATVSPNPHQHTITGTDGDTSGAGAPLSRTPGVPESGGATNHTSLDVSVTTSIGNTGGGQGHNNIQPVIATYFIMYIP